MYSSYTAACFARKHDLAEKYGVNLAGALTWAFEFEGQPYFAGFRSLASNGLDKPVLNVFRMYSKMSGQRVQLESDHSISLDTIVRNGVRGEPDVAGLASLDKRTLSVMVWHYHDDDLPGADADITINVDGVPARASRAKVQHYRIDENHSNAFAAWKRLGSPQQPTPQQYASLEAAGQLGSLGPTESVTLNHGNGTLRFKLPRQAVSLVQVNW